MGVITGDGDHEMDLKITQQRDQNQSGNPRGEVLRTMDDRQRENGATHPDRDDNRSHRHHANHRPLEPHLTILQIEAHVCQISNEVWLARNLLTEAGPD